MADGIVSTPAADVLVSAAMAPSGQSERKQARRENWRLIRRRPSFIIGNVIALFWVVCAILGDSITPHHPLDFRAKAHLAPSADYWFGTDKTGRDVFSRVLAGARDVLKIAPLAALLGVLFGVILGLLMGYIGNTKTKESLPPIRLGDTVEVTDLVLSSRTGGNQVTYNAWWTRGGFNKTVDREVDYRPNTFSRQLHGKVKRKSV